MSNGECKKYLVLSNSNYNMTNFEDQAGAQFRNGPVRAVVVSKQNLGLRVTE